jgi:anti-anti-sigma factor
MADIHIDIAEHPDHVLVKVFGEVPLAAAEAFDRTLMRVSVKHPRLVLMDLSQMTSISSMVMGVLVNFHRAVKLGSGRVILVAVPAQIQTALERANLLRVFPFAETVEAAIHGKD